MVDQPCQRAAWRLAVAAVCSFKPAEEKAAWFSAAGRARQRVGKLSIAILISRSPCRLFGNEVVIHRVPINITDAGHGVLVASTGTKVGSTINISELHRTLLMRGIELGSRSGKLS